MAAPRRKRYSIIVSSGTKELQANHLALYTPDLKEIADDIKKELSTNFKSVEVKVYDECPTLNDFGDLPGELHGICGNTRIAEIGGLPYLYNSKYQTKQQYAMSNITEAAGFKKGQQPLVFGLASPVHSVVGHPGELIVNVHAAGSRNTKLCKIGPLNVLKDVENESDEESGDISEASTAMPQKHSKRPSETAKDLKATLAAIDDEKKDKEQQGIEPKNGLLVGMYVSYDIGCKGNLFLCDGTNNEPVLYVKVSTRIGKLSVVNAIREAFKKVKGVEKTAQIGVGGIIRVRKGKVKVHVSPKYEELDYNDNEAIKKTQKVFEIGPDLVMFTTFLTDDPSENNKFHLTMEATGCYHYKAKKEVLHGSHVNEGGAFIESATDDIIEYEGYFSLAKYIYRIEDAYYNIEHEKGGK